MYALGGTRRCVLVALIAVLVMVVGATGAYAGGRDYGSAPGHQKWSSDEGSKGSQDQSQDQSWSWSDSNDESDSSDSNGQSGDQNGKDCKQNEGQSSEQTGEQGQTNGPPPVTTGGQGQEGEKGHEGSKEGTKEGTKGEKGKNENKGKENQGGKVPGGGTTPKVETPTTPTTVPTQTQAQTPVATTPVTTPVETQQTPGQGGQVQGETQESPGPSAKQGESNGGRVLAENTTPVANVSQASGLAGTGFDAWLVALLGVGCVAGAGLLLRRTRRS